MPAFDGSFYNLATDSRLATPLGGTGSFDARLEAAIQFIHDSPIPEGVIWFPPGTYRIRTGKVIQANITLSFAPGALLVPVVPSGAGDSLEETSIQIAGRIEADPREGRDRARSSTDYAASARASTLLRYRRAKYFQHAGPGSYGSPDREGNFSADTFDFS